MGVFLLWFSLCLIVGFLEVINRQQLPPAEITMLHFTDCVLPCWIGIKAGETTLQEAQERIMAIYGQSADYQVSFESPLFYSLKAKIVPFADPTKPFTVNLSTDTQNAADQIVVNVAFGFGRTKIPIREVYSLLGKPSDLAQSALRGRCRVRLVYDNMIDVMIENGQNTRVNWDQPIQALTIYKNGALPRSQLETWDIWRGLAKLETC